MMWQHDGIEELIVQGKGRVAAYSFQGGQPKWWVRGWGFDAVTTPVAGDGMLFVGGCETGDPTEPDDPLFDWAKLIAKYDVNKDGNLALEEIPESLIWRIRKEIPLDVPGNAYPMRSLLRDFTDANKDGIVTKAEWDADEASTKDKFNADRFVAIRPGGHGDTTATHVQWETTKDPPQSLKPLFSNGLVGYYPFNGNANDESGMGNNGTAIGAILTTDRFGDQGKAMAFNGINQYVQVPNQTYLQFGEFTISCWVNLNDPTQSQYFIGKGVVAGFSFDWIFEYGPQLGYTTPLGMSFCVLHNSTNALYASSNWRPAPATWHHYLYTKTASENGTYFTLFLDGRLESIEEGTSMRSSTSPLTIGQAGGSGWVNGMMDDVRIYNRALSAQEVQDLYAYEAPEQPSLTINVKTVRVTMRVKPTKKYQLEVSLDLNKWTNAGDVFTATSSEIRQQYNVIEVGRFFRLSEVP